MPRYNTEFATNLTHPGGSKEDPYARVGEIIVVSFDSDTLIPDLDMHGKSPADIEDRGQIIRSGEGITVLSEGDESREKGFRETVDFVKAATPSHVPVNGKLDLPNSILLLYP